MTIDRIIFLRICEDRNLEPEEKLLSLSMGSAIYSALLENFIATQTRSTIPACSTSREEKGTDHQPG